MSSVGKSMLGTASAFASLLYCVTPGYAGDTRDDVQVRLDSGQDTLSLKLSTDSTDEDLEKKGLAAMAQGVTVRLLLPSDTADALSLSLPGTDNDASTFESSPALDNARQR